MEKIIEEWVKYCKGDKSIDKSHFFTLLMDENLTTGDIERIFSEFPNSPKLIRRFNSLKSVGVTTHTTHTTSIENLLSITKKDIQEKLKLIDQFDDNSFLKKIKELDYHYIDDNEALSSIMTEDYFHSEFISEVGFYINQNRKFKGHAYYGLAEALYGYTYDYQLVWYVLKPLINLNVNLDFYFNLLDLGGNYAICQRGVFISKSNW